MTADQIDILRRIDEALEALADTTADPVRIELSADAYHAFCELREKIWPVPFGETRDHPRYDGLPIFEVAGALNSIVVQSADGSGVYSQPI